MKALLKRLVRPLTSRLFNRVSILLEQSRSQVLEQCRLDLAERTLPLEAKILALRSELNDTTALLAAREASLRHVEAQMEAIRTDLYFLAAPSRVAPAADRVVELRVPETVIRFSIAGPRQDPTIEAIADAQGLYEPHLVHMLQRLVRPDQCCIDIGAGLGAITLPLSVLVPDGQVYALEPGDDFYYLQQNVSANRRTNVTVCRFGLSDKREVVTDATPAAAGVVSVGLLAAGEGRGTASEGPTMIACVALDEWISTAGMAHPDLIRLNAAGRELAVLRGARDALARHQTDLVLAWSPHRLVGSRQDAASELYATLTAYWDEIVLLAAGEAGNPITINSFEQLMSLPGGGSGQDYLYCTRPGR